MIPIRNLTNKVTRLERQRQKHAEFQIIEEFLPEGDFNGECHYALLRNGVPVVRWPRMLSTEEWEKRYCPSLETVN